MSGEQGILLLYNDDPCPFGLEEGFKDPVWIASEYQSPKNKQIEKWLLLLLY
jgi:hypothetical protein